MVVDLETEERTGAVFFTAPDQGPVRSSGPESFRFRARIIGCSAKKKREALNHSMFSTCTRFLKTPLDHLNRYSEMPKTRGLSHKKSNEHPNMLCATRSNPTAKSAADGSSCFAVRPPAGPGPGRHSLSCSQ